MRVTEKSDALMARAQKIIPGGVNSPVRSFKSVGGKSFVASRGEGPYIFDLDNNKYVDLVCSWGALIHGHNHPRIRAAIERSLEWGTSFGITSPPEVKLCELMTQNVKGLEMCRLVNSGTEACMSAIRLARGVTGRDLLIKFDGNYHGHGDSFLVGAGSGAATLQVPDSAGVTKHVLQDTVVLPFNDVTALESIFKSRGKEIAGIILEVVCGNMGVVAPDFGFLNALRKLTRENGALLIFDEVMTGFRLGVSGSQNIYGIEPDLITLGKVIGGGMPVGAYGGKLEFMKNVAPLGNVYQAGTLSGNPLGASAGIASLELLLEGGSLFYQRLDSIASEWKSQMDSHIKTQGYPVSVAQMGSMLTVFFMPEIPKNFSEAKRVDLAAFKKFFWAMLEDGVYYPPSQYEACFLSAAHSDSVMEKVCETSLKALDAAFMGGRA